MGSFSKFLVIILFKKDFLTGRGLVEEVSQIPLYLLLVNCVLWVLGALQLLSCY